jgi:RNA ligase
MTRLSDLLDIAELRAAIDGGYVRDQVHPTVPLSIFNYTERAQFEQEWTPVTLQCRGLIVDEAGQVVARPWRKFFNYGDPTTGVLDLNAKAEVTVKMDGSLGILYPGDGGWAVATRGSFTSEQAMHATQVLRDRYGDFEPPAGMTVLFEIVYPANRIVCDYGATDDLILLGAVDIETGESVGPDWVSGWWGPQADTFTAGTLAEALTLPPRPNAEGVVVRLVDFGVMVKIKQADYVEMHRILTQTTARSVWEFIVVDECARLIAKPKHWGSRLGLDPARAAEILALGDNWLDRLTSDVPDEFHGWLRATIDGFHRKARDLRQQLDQICKEGRARYGDDRPAFAAAFKNHEHSGALFLLYDDRDITTYVWRHLFPPPEKAWGHRSEDVA